MQPFGRNGNGPKIGAVPFERGGAGSPPNTMWPGPKTGGLCPFEGGGAGSPSNTMWPGPRPTCMPSGILIYAAIWTQRIWAENWGLCPFGRGGAGSPPNTMWPGPTLVNVGHCIIFVLES